MGKAKGPTLFRGQAQGRCLACKNLFVGPGDRCQPCARELKQRRKRKPR